MSIFRRVPLVLLAPLALYLVALFLIALLVVKPPLLGWLGFGVAAMIGAVIMTAAASLFRRAGVNVDPAPRVGDGVHRVLVLADAQPGPGLARELRPHLRTPGAVHVVSPVLVTPAHFLAEAERHETDEAKIRLDAVLAALRGSGIDATGAVGTDDPLQAIGDALATFPADEIVVLTTEESHETWLEHGLRGRARQLFRIPVACIRVEPRRADRPAVKQHA